MPDAAGNPAWSCEYIGGIPAGSDLDTSDSVAPWYTLSSSGMMVWDGHYGEGAWLKQYDTPPGCSYTGLWHVCNDSSYQGDHYANVPLRRWDNPSSEPLVVSLMGGEDFGAVINKLPTGAVADIVIARTDASDNDSVHLLYSQTLTKTMT